MDHYRELNYFIQKGLIDPNKYIILNGSPCYNLCWRFCRCKTNSNHKKLWSGKKCKFPEYKIVEKGEIYLCSVDRDKKYPSAFVMGINQRSFTIKQFDKWFDEIVDYSIHTIQEAREKYKTIQHFY